MNTQHHNPGKKPDKILATDLDGTLFNGDSQISAKTLAALSRATSLGFETIAVTGRSWRTAVSILKPAVGIDYIVCSNGAYLYRQSTASIHWQTLFDTMQTQNLITMIKQLLPQACFGWESESGFCFDELFTELAGGGAPEYGGDKSALGTVDHYKIFVRDPVVAPADVMKLLWQPLNGLVEMSTSGAPFVELTCHGTHKASGLQRVATELGIAAERTVAFGDNHNDIPMLKWAGHSVAMGNAVDEVKVLSSKMTDTNHNDGVAAYIDTHLSAWV